MQRRRWIIIASLTTAPLFATLACKDDESKATESASAAPAPIPMPTMAASSPFSVETIFGDAADPENPMNVFQQLDASALGANGLMQAFIGDGGPFAQMLAAQSDEGGIRAQPAAKRQRRGRDSNPR